ncbi:hypothetical protein ACP70R_041294 [Stipagrostis hirtigluma subsp. patula]
MPRVRPESAAAGVVVVEDTDALDCGVCYLNLPEIIATLTISYDIVCPIPAVNQADRFYWCNSGHVVCSRCHEKLKAFGRCHVCRIPANGYFRCHAMEHLVESIRVPCPYTADGCTARPAYYDLDTHCQVCPHAWCCCPGVACGFIGSVVSLLDHFTGVHGWPRATKISVGDYQMCHIRLHDGFNFLLANRAAYGKGATATPGRQYLFLLNVVRRPFGRAISVFCIRPHAAGSDGQAPSMEMKFQLSYSRYAYQNSCPREGDQFVDYYQKSTFRVACTDLSKRKFLVCH